MIALMMAAAVAGAQFDLKCVGTATELNETKTPIKSVTPFSAEIVIDLKTNRFAFIGPGRPGTPVTIQAVTAEEIKLATSSWGSTEIDRATGKLTIKSDPMEGLAFYNEADCSKAPFKGFAATKF